MVTLPAAGHANSVAAGVGVAQDPQERKEKLHCQEGTTSSNLGPVPQPLLCETVIYLLWFNPVIFQVFETSLQLT